MGASKARCVGATDLLRWVDLHSPHDPYRQGIRGNQPRYVQPSTSLFLSHFGFCRDSGLVDDDPSFDQLGLYEPARAA